MSSAISPSTRSNGRWPSVAGCPVRPHYVRPLAARHCAKVGSRSARQQYAHAVAETSYAPCGDLSLAYQVFGDGPVELVFVGPIVSHVELFWTLPEFKAFFERLATFCRVVMFDKAGVGLSDPVPKVRSLDDRAAEIEAVMDAVGFGKAVLFAVSEGGPAAIVFAATRPERTRALILHGTFAYSRRAGWDDIDRDPAELRARVLAELGEDYTPSTEQIARVQEFVRAVRSAWGSGAALKCLRAVGPVDTPARNVGAHVREPGDGAGDSRSERSGSTCGRSCRRSPRPPWSSMPARTPCPVQGGRYLADHIPGARYLEVDGADHAPWLTEPDTILTEIEEFLTGSHDGPCPCPVPQRPGKPSP